MKTALITGASSGIGREISYILAKKGYSLILVGRRRERLIEAADYVHNKYKVQVVIKVCDVSEPDECRRLYEEARPYHIDVLVNCAGVCLAEDFTQSELDEELSMVDTNARAVHILMKLFLQDMQHRIDTYILNVADTAGLKSFGPHRAAYCASKAYIVSLSQAVAAELRMSDSPTSVSVLCPGPVETDFYANNGLDTPEKPMDPKACAKTAVRGMFRKKSVIIAARGLVNGDKLNLLLRKLKVFAACFFLGIAAAGTCCVTHATEADTAQEAGAAGSEGNDDEQAADGAEALDEEALAIAAPEPLPAASYTIPDDADLTYEEVEYKPVETYHPEREPMNGQRIAIKYKGTDYPAYYWAPGDLVVLQVSLADDNIPAFSELSQEDRETWTAFLDDDFATPEEAYYAQMLPTYTFWFDFDKNKIIPFVEFDYGTEGKVVMMDYTEDQMYYLEELSPSFLKLPPFEFETYQFLTVNDDSCYHILSCMDQVGNIYLYQYDANGNACARADVNTLIGLRYLAERTIALNEQIDKVQAYQDNIRKIIAGVVIFVVVILLAFIYILMASRHKKVRLDSGGSGKGGGGEDPDMIDLEDPDMLDLEDSDTADLKAPDMADYGAPDTTDLDIPDMTDYGPPDTIDLGAPDMTDYGTPETIDRKVPDIPDIGLVDITATDFREEKPAEQAKPKEPPISADELEKLTIRYTGTDSARLKLDVMDELSQTGFKPELDEGDPTEGGLFYPGDTEVMRNMFRPPTESASRRKHTWYDDYDDDDEEDEALYESERQPAAKAAPVSYDDDDDEVLDLSDI